MLGFLKTFVKRLSQQRGAGLLAPGTLAPEFDVVDHLDRRQRLADYRGHKVVLWFYPKADTPG
jgi:peroxiredoxin